MRQVDFPCSLAGSTMNHRTLASTGYVWFLPRITDGPPKKFSSNCENETKTGECLQENTDLKPLAHSSESFTTDDNTSTFDHKWKRQLLKILLLAQQTNLCWNTVQQRRRKTKTNINLWIWQQKSQNMLKRLNKELKDIVLESPTNYSVIVPDEEDVTVWQGILLGPDNTEYERGIFILEIRFPSCYPFKPPRVQFRTPILHCNISAAGHLNLDLLKDQWSPALTISKVLLSTHSLLLDPNPDDPLVPDLARLYKQDRKTYSEKVRSYTRQHAVVNCHKSALDVGIKFPSRVYALTAICRHRLRRSLWMHSVLHVNSNIKKLPLPSRMKNYLLFAEGLL